VLKPPWSNPKMIWQKTLKNTSKYKRELSKCAKERKLVLLTILMGDYLKNNSDKLYVSCQKNENKKCVKYRLLEMLLLNFVLFVLAEQRTLTQSDYVTHTHTQQTSEAKSILHTTLPCTTTTTTFVRSPSSSSSPSSSCSCCLSF